MTTEASEQRPSVGLNHDQPTFALPPSVLKSYQANGSGVPG